MADELVPVFRVEEGREVVDTCRREAGPRTNRHSERYGRSPSVLAVLSGSWRESAPPTCLLLDVAVGEALTI